MKILITDDDSSTVNALRACLVSCGYEVATAANGNQALTAITESIEASKPMDLMVSDFVMPGMNGLDLIRSARELVPELPVILVTAYGVREVQTEVKKLERCAYIEKPFVPFALFQKIHQLTSGT